VLAVGKLDAQTQGKVSDFLADVMQLLGDRLKKAIARPANTTAGADPMADVEVLLVVDDLPTREMYRIWDLAGEASLRHYTVFSVHAYSVKDFEQRINLPSIAVFLAEGVEYDLR
jgi:hypothetical protein